VRGLRFNHFFRDGQLHYRGGVPLSAAQRLAPVMAELGWHLQLWIDVKDLPGTIPVLKQIGLPVVIDHMGRTDARAGTATEGFQSLLRAVGDGWCWAKLSGAYRISRTRRTIPTRGRFMKHWCAPIRNGWCGAATGRIRASRAKCPMPDACSNCFRRGRQTRQRCNVSS
jgi:predicted TIM-barrel fold metal-dependent hydrolase